MENKNEVFNDDKINKNLLIFDKGFNDIQELSSKKKLIEISIKKKKVCWYDVYINLFKNTLSSKHAIPQEELKLRLNMIRKHLPSYYNAQKPSESSNSNSLLKKFTYHVYPKNNFIKRLLDKSNKRTSLLLFDDNENKENETNQPKNIVFQRRVRKTKTQKFTSNLNLFNFGVRRGSIQKNSPLDIKGLNPIQEYSPSRPSKIFQEGLSADKRRKLGKRSTIKMDSTSMNKLLFKQAKKKQKSNFYFLDFERKAKLKLDKQNELNELENINKDYLIRTPNDNEYSLILSDKRNIIDRTYFIEYLNKLNLETKNEKVNTFKRELATQMLKFNELYYDSKLEDFGSDKTFNDIKTTCDLFINRFNFDKNEDKIISDLESFL